MNYFKELLSSCLILSGFSGHVRGQSTIGTLFSFNMFSLVTRFVLQFFATDFFRFFNFHTFELTSTFRVTQNLKRYSRFWLGAGLRRTGRSSSLTSYESWLRAPSPKQFTVDFSRDLQYEKLIENTVPVPLENS